MFGFGALSAAKTLTPTQVRQMGDPVTLVYVREDGEWASGHMAGAVHIPLGRLRDEMDRIPSGKPVVFYCHVGGRSSQAIAIAMAAGQTHDTQMGAASAPGVRKVSHLRPDIDGVAHWLDTVANPRLSAVTRVYRARVLVVLTGLRARRLCLRRPPPPLAPCRACDGPAHRSYRPASESRRYWGCCAMSRWNEDTPTVRNFLFKNQFVFRGTHLHPATASVEAQKLIRLGMCFKANLPADGNRHQRDLQIAPAPGDETIVFVFLGRVFDVERLRLRANVIDLHFSTRSKRSTTMCELIALSHGFGGQANAAPVRRTVRQGLNHAA